MKHESNRLDLWDKNALCFIEYAPICQNKLIGESYSIRPAFAKTY